MAYTVPIDTQDALDTFKAALTRAMNGYESAEADDFCMFYEGFLADNPTFPLEKPDMAAAYNDIYQKARWVALPLLADEKDVVSMFGSQMGWLKSLPDFDLLDTLKDHMKGVDVRDRDARKNKIRDALVQNKEVITPPFVAVANKLQKKGTVGDWVSEYLSFMGPEVDNALLQARFAAETDFAKQKKDDQEFLRRLFSIVEYTRQSSQTNRGFEGGRLMDVDGSVVMYANGTLEDLDTEDVRAFRSGIKEQAMKSRQEALRTAFVDPPEYAAAVREAAARVEQESGGDAQKLQRAVVAAVVGTGKKPVREEVVGLLRAFAAKAELKQLLTERPILDLVRGFLEKEKRTVDLDTFKVFPGAPQFAGLLVQLIFQERLGLPEHDAAREALQLANILRKKGDQSLMEIAFFDDAQRVFAWKTPLRKTIQK